MSSVLDAASQVFKSIIGGGNYATTYVTSTVDGKRYKVRDMADKQEAADLMAKLRIRLMKLCSILESKYPDKPQVKQMVRNFRSDPDRFLESTPDAQHTSAQNLLDTVQTSGITLDGYLKKQKPMGFTDIQIFLHIQ